MNEIRIFPVYMQEVSKHSYNKYRNGKNFAERAGA